MNAPIVVLVALAASIAAGGILVCGIALVTRLRGLDAATRHQLWFATLVAIALLPVVGIGASLVHAQRTPSPAWTAPSSHSRDAMSTRSTQAAASTARASSSREAAPATETDGSKGSSLRWSVAGVPGGIARLVLVALAAVALLGLIALGVSMVRVEAVKRRSSPLDEDLANDLPWLTQTKQGRETYLRLSYEIEAPVAIGFRRPVILIPTDLATRGGLDGIEDLVVHEHEHLRRFDDYTNLVQRAIERIFWFNPFVWFVGRQIALHREMAADDAVVRLGEDRTRYADTLWRLAKEMRMPAHTVVAPGALFSRKQISLRIEALLAPGHAQLRKLGPATAAAAVGIALFSCALVALAAPPLQVAGPPSTDDAKMQSALAPAAPAAPAAPGASQKTTDQGLKRLSTLIAARLADMKASVTAMRSIPQHEASDLHHETSLLRDKLATMQHMAQDSAANADVRDRIAELQSSARSLDGDVADRTDESSGSGNATSGNVHVNVPPIHVNVPATHVDVPAIHVDVPSVNVDVPGVHVQVPAVHVQVPAVHVDVPRVSTSTSTSAKNVAMNDEGGVPTSVTREMLANCVGCNLAGRNMRNMDLHGVHLTGSDLRNADLRGANLRDADLTGCDLRDAKFDGADMTNAKLAGADLGNATFSGTRMEGVEMTGISLRHTKVENGAIRDILARGCKGCDLSHMDLHGLDLHGLHVEGADFSHTDLSGANLSATQLTGVSFDEANLRHADLRNAQIVGCSFRHTQLDGAAFEGIKLTGTQLDL